MSIRTDQSEQTCRPRQAAPQGAVLSVFTLFVIPPVSFWCMTYLFVKLNCLFLGPSWKLFKMSQF